MRRSLRCEWKTIESATRWIIEKLLTAQTIDNRKTIDSAHAIVYNVITEDDGYIRKQ